MWMRGRGENRKKIRSDCISKRIFLFYLTMQINYRFVKVFITLRVYFFLSK